MEMICPLFCMVNPDDSTFILTLIASISDRLSSKTAAIKCLQSIMKANLTLNLSFLPTAAMFFVLTRSEAQLVAAVLAK